jgi:hypothetical protein
VSAFGGGVYPKIVLHSVTGVESDKTWTFSDNDNLTGYRLDFPQVRFSRFGPTQDSAHVFVTRFGGRHVSARLTLNGWNNAALVAFLHKAACWRGEVRFYPAPAVLTWPGSSRDWWRVNIDLPNLEMQFGIDSAGNVRTNSGHDIEVTLEGYEEMTAPPDSHPALSSEVEIGVGGRCVGGTEAVANTDGPLGAIIGYGKLGSV